MSMSHMSINRNVRDIILMLILSVCVAAVATLRDVTSASEGVLGLNGTVWVTNRSLNNIARFDAATGLVKGIAAVERAPIGITIPPGSGKVYVSNEASDTVSVLSASTLSPVARIGTGPRPHHLIHDPSGRFVYVAAYGSNQVAVIETRTDTRVGSLQASASTTARTHAAWPGRAGTLYAVSEGTNDLAAIDVNTRQITWTLAVGNRPSEVLVTRDGRKAYVSVRNEDKVKVVDLQTRTIVGETVVGVQPDTLQLTADGRTLIIGLRGIPARMAFVDTASLHVAWVDVGAVTTGHQWLSDDSQFTFIAVEAPGTLSGVAVVDNTRRKLITVYPYPGGGLPHGVFYEPRR